MLLDKKDFAPDLKMQQNTGQLGVGWGGGVERGEHYIFHSSIHASVPVKMLKIINSLGIILPDVNVKPDCIFS